jgi:phosphatidate cytidylyltransferase
VGPGLLPGSADRLTGLHQLLQDGLVLAIVAAVIVGMGLIEYARIARRLGAECAAAGLAGVGVVLFLLQWLGWAHSSGHLTVCPAWLRQPMLTIVLGLCAVVLGLLGLRALQGRIQRTGATTALFALGLLYVLLPLGFVSGVRVRWGVGGVLVMLAVCKFTDVGAYYAGKLIGGPKLAPIVSPRKTWAGAGGALVGGCAIALAARALGWSGLSPALALTYGTLMAAGAVVADLAESVLKREAVIKDSGRLLPGSGGVLDMADDVLFAAPFTYVFFALFHV